MIYAELFRINTHWIGKLMAVEKTKGEPARNGKLASVGFR
jgi:hypothetical protein